MTLKSLSLFVGTGKCNANCAHCAGEPLRKYAPKKDGEINSYLIKKTILECHQEGARSISVSGSGEPTLSPKAVTKTLDLILEVGNQGKKYEWLNLYSNGIKIGENKKFAEEYLPLWKNLGLKTIYITVHNLDEKKNAEVYRVKNYPCLDKIVSRIHDAGLLTRANIVLTKKNVGTANKFSSIIEGLIEKGFDHISAWPIRNLEDKLDKELAPENEELDKMENWIKENPVENCRIRLLREKNRDVYETGQKLTLFPDGTLSNSWCN